MRLSIPGLHTEPVPAAGPLLCIHSSGAWSYAGGDDEDELWPIVATFEV